MKGRDAMHKNIKEISPGVIAAGPLTKQPGTRWFRTIIKDWIAEWGVNDEIRKENGDYEYANGFYTKDLSVAMQEFARRLLEQANCINSIYREEKP